MKRRKARQKKMNSFLFKSPNWRTQVSNFPFDPKVISPRASSADLYSKVSHLCLTNCGLAMGMKPSSANV